MLYAKSDPKESIKQHTNELLERLEIIKRTYSDDILKDKNINPERFWYLLHIICQYHDCGKAYTPFQNKILHKIGEKELPTQFNSNQIKHEQLSPFFIPFHELDLTKDEKKLVIQAIYYHHEREAKEADRELIEKIISIDILPRINEIEKELGITLQKEMTTSYLKYTQNRKRIEQGDDLYIPYCLLKGLLHRLDHSASAHIKVEEITTDDISDFVEKSLERKDYNKTELQEFCTQNSNQNLMVISSTGSGKTEAGLLWTKTSKMFFTLPIRVSINAIFTRVKKDIDYKHVGLLHSSSLEYLEDNFEEPMLTYEQSRNLAVKINTCTIDQIFPFVFKYKGYEKIYATLSYSKVIIDEIQAYSPEIVAVILKGLQMINEIGGKFLIMTATLPRIYKEKLEELQVPFKFRKFDSDIKRHKIRLEQKEIMEDIDLILEKGKKGKVLVIANTVNKAIEIYRALLKKKAVNISMLHSRFIAKDRAKLEEDILEFSKSSQSGIWITTQIVEASLDIDFDCLFTEMSTLDSLFQRLGRCFRKREYKGELPNVYIYEKNCSGVSSVYDDVIHKKSKELLQKYNNKLLEEQDKVDLVDILYSNETLQGSKFLTQFESAFTFLKYLPDYDTRKSEAQKILRNIENIKVIPKTIYDDNLDLFEKYHKAVGFDEKKEMKRKMRKLITHITLKQKWLYRDKISPCIHVDDIFSIDLNYTSDMGLLLEKDEEYDINSRTL